MNLPPLHSLKRSATFPAAQDLQTNLDRSGTHRSVASYYGVGKIRKYESAKLEFLKDLHNQLCKI